jgi:predicted CXXCH cytochrome family protein
MTQVATPESVVAPFDGVELASRGRQYRLSREGDGFYVTMADPDWEAGALANGIDIERARPPMAKLRVVMTTGSHHMQGYWVSSNVKNMLRQVPWVYLIHDRKWVPREDIFLSPPHGHRHFAVWNDNCIVCHAVAGAPKFDLQAIKVATEVAELGISCEACHGPGKPHWDWHTIPGRKAKGPDPVVQPARLTSKASSEVCGQCHGYFRPVDMQAFSTEGYAYRAAAGQLDKTHHFITHEESKQFPSEAAYWDDGTCRVSGREYSAQKESACFQKGELSCLSCHSMHSADPNDLLSKGMEANQACLQCHQEFASKLEQHTHHPADSSGSLCYNCHMPHTTYGLLKGIRSHRIQSPRVLSGERLDHPNACNLCHLDQTLEWSAEKLSQWYGQARPNLSDEEKQVAASLLWLLKGDALQRVITAWHFSWPAALEASGREWQAPFLAQLLTDDYSVIRYMAASGLAAYPEWTGMSYDYVGSRQHQQTIQAQVVKRWSQTNREPNQRSARLMLDANRGTWNRERIQELLRRQDKREMYLPE